MKLTWTTILIFDVHFDVQFNGTPQMRDAVLILNHSFMYILYHSPNRSASLATSTKKALVDVTFSATTTRASSYYLNVPNASLVLASRQAI